MKDYQSKTCKRCEFIFVPTSGHQIYCLNCREIKKREWKKKWRDNNHDKIKLYWQRPDVKERARIRSNKWRKNNPKDRKIIQQHYRERHKKEICEKAKLYRQRPYVKKK